MIIDSQGRQELLNLGNLIAFDAQNAFPNCKVNGAVSIQIAFDLSHPEHVKSQLIIPRSGEERQMNFENLVKFAAKTVEMSCKENQESRSPEKNVYEKSRDIPRAIKIMFENSANGNLNTFIVDSLGNKDTLNLGNLLAAVAKAVPYSHTVGKAQLEISFNKDENGTIHGYLKDLSGNKVDLNLQNLLNSAAYFFMVINIEL